MELMERLNSVPMFLIAGAVIVMVMVLCVIFMVKSYRAGIAMGMEKEKLRNAITSSATFTLLPSVSILLGVIALAGSLGIPLPWMRLSVVGALHYEGNVADIAARAAGMPGGLGTAELTASTFVTIGFVMAAGIILGCVLCVLFLKPYLNRVRRPKKASAETQPSQKQGLGDVLFTAMFVGLVSTYIGSYVGTLTSTGDWMPLAVAFVAGLSMEVFEYVSRKRNITWLDNFSMAGSMLIGMAAAIGLGAL
ncbi:DUF5058 family protein [Ruthenibacterium sp. CLA-JM-H11]|uniref:DUF5058 family protein n=1 Tax=Ruthenibacterium intestinale TaxID=3133163 RepID=A0ABV1GD44_9FIRM